LLLVGTVLAAFVAIAADVGSQSDPLVTLSYLNNTFLPKVLAQVDEKLSGQTTGTTTGDAQSYTAVSLTAGQILYGDAGCEVLLRSGSASCVASDGATPGLVDSTTGGSINHGQSLTANHLYLMTTQRGVKAAGAVTLLVRGGYTIG
jgi:hypothetical protein